MDKTPLVCYLSLDHLPAHISRESERKGRKSLYFFVLLLLKVLTGVRGWGTV